jgi:hypothetical protein
MITKKARFVLIAALTLLVTAGLFAQEAAPVRSWYVSAKGSNDNNGRTPETAFATFGKAFTSAAASTVKTVTVVGAFNGRSSSSDFPRDGSGATEILVTGLDENAVVNNFVIMGNSNTNTKPSKIRIETLRFGEKGCLEVIGNTTLTIGKDTVIDIVNDYISDPVLDIGEGATVIMEANAVMRAGKGGAAARGDGAADVKGGTFTMKDDTQISGFGAGVYVSSPGSPGSFTMQNNAKITGCSGRGVSLNADYNNTLSFTMMNNASISGNGSDTSGGGLKVDIVNGSVIIQDNASITNNTAKDSYGKPGEGGGIYINNGEVLIKGNAVISGNKAKQGGGIYFSGYVYDSYSAIIGGTAKQPLVQKGKGSNLTIQDKVQITGNEAQEGGGIYAKQGGAFYTVNFTAANDHYDKNSGYYSDILPASVKPLTYTYTGATMKGGTISGNKADYGAGVYIEQAVQVEMYKSSNSSQYRTVSGVETMISSTGQKVAALAFTLAGGSITGNDAQFVGGGIYVKDAAAFKKGAGTISGNTAGDGEGEDLYTP